MHNDGNDSRNLILALVLSMLVIVVWQYFFTPPAPPPAPEQSQDSMLPGLPQDAIGSVQAPDRDTLLAAGPRIPVQSDVVKGSLRADTLRLDDLQLPEYRTHVQEDSPPVTLLSPSGSAQSYFAEFGWLAKENVPVPGAQTQWQTTAQQLTEQSPVNASWDNGSGLKFTRQIAIEGDYLFRVKQAVVNQSQQSVTLYPWGRVNRSFEDDKEHFFILHEGPLGVFNGRLQEFTYEDLRDDPQQEFKSERGWIGMTDKYWLMALVPDKQSAFTARMKFTDTGSDTYQVDYTGQGITLAPGQTIELTHRLFAGAKKVKLLDEYAQTHDIALFDRSVDFGMLYFLTKPIFYALDFFNSLLGSFGLAILLLTICIKIILFPLANKSYKAMSQMKILMPKIKELRELYGEDKMKLNQEVMALYKKEKVNPASGCVPILLQIPIFFALYKVLFITIEMRHEAFYGWIDDLSAPDPTSIFNAFGLIPWDPPQMLMIGAWPIIMAVTMIVQQKLNPPPADPAQAMVMKLLPFIFLFLFATFPAGLVIYWAWNNTLSILQQWVIMQKYKKSQSVS